MRSSVVEPQNPRGVGTRSSNAPRSDIRPPYPQQRMPKPPRYETKSSIIPVPAEGWLAMLLLAVSVYCVVFSIVAANWVSHSFILFWSTAAGLLLGLVVAKIHRFPQAILHLAACLAGHWLSIWLTSVLAYHISWLLLLENLRSVIGGGFTSAVSPGSAMVFLFYLSFLCFFLGYFGSWLIYRAHLPWLVALVYCAIMLVNLNYVKQDLSLLVIVMLGALILLIARIHLVNQLNQWMNDGLHTDRTWLRNISRRFVQIPAVFALLALLAASILPVLAQPASGVSFWNMLDNAWTNITSGQFSLSAPGQLFSPYEAPANFFGDTLAITGNVNLPSGEVLYYSSTAQQQSQYLEGFTYDHFDGHIWTSSIPGQAQLYPANSPLPFDDSGNGTHQQVTTSVTVLLPPEGTKHYIFAPADPQSFNVDTIVYDNGSNLTTAWTQRAPLTAGEHYTAVSMVSTAGATDLSTVPLYQDNQDFWASDGYFQQLQNYYLQTPADLSRAVFQTALNWTQSATNEYDAALMLEQHLNNSSQFTYSVSNPPVPSNVDAVDWLLQTHRGYCTYYATAMTIMARLLGMPARVVNGFSQGHYDSTRKAWVVDGTDAHSWVQVYFPGFGWINFDPTPGFSFNGAANPQPIPSPAPTQHRPTPTPTVTGGSTPGKHHTPTPASSGSGGNSSAKPETQGLFLGFSILILLASLFMLLLAIARYRRVTAAGVTTISSIFWRLSRLASLAGMPPQPWQTPYEYTRTLSRHYPQARTPLRRLAELFVRERWAPAHQAPRAAEAEDIEKLWPTLRNSLLRSLFRRLARIGRK
ncbi:MAG TPA: transglutaminaseTgpA domain-containing protein [Ktedonobacteraceae bacterium]|nr:transglutaminaseTgpA domain-containing protein [Ktedonobacteraceae bacterium]